jgi:hypothetical protein
MSELLRKEQGKGEVAQEQNGKNQGNDGCNVCLHGLPQLLTRLDVKKRQAEENYREQQHPYILHSGSLDFIEQIVVGSPAQESFWLSPAKSIQKTS